MSWSQKQTNKNKISSGQILAAVSEICVANLIPRASQDVESRGVLNLWLWAHFHLQRGSHLEGGLCGRCWQDSPDERFCSAPKVGEVEASGFYWLPPWLMTLQLATVHTNEMRLHRIQLNWTLEEIIYRRDVARWCLRRVMVQWFQSWGGSPTFCKWKLVIGYRLIAKGCQLRTHIIINNDIR